MLRPVDDAAGCGKVPVQMFAGCRAVALLLYMIVVGQLLFQAGAALSRNKIGMTCRVFISILMNNKPLDLFRSLY